MVGDFDEFDLSDEPAGEDPSENDPESSDALDFGDTGHPANYYFCIGDDDDIGYAACVVPVAYWDDNKELSDWQLKLDIPGFSQEMDGVYSYDKSDLLRKESALEVLHKKLEKLGCRYNNDLAEFMEDSGVTVYVPSTLEENVTQAAPGARGARGARDDEKTVPGKTKTGGAISLGEASTKPVPGVVMPASKPTKARGASKNKTVSR